MVAKVIALEYTGTTEVEKDTEADAPGYSGVADGSLVMVRVDGTQIGGNDETPAIEMPAQGAGHICIVRGTAGGEGGAGGVAGNGCPGNGGAGAQGGPAVDFHTDGELIIISGGTCGGGEGGDGGSGTGGGGNKSCSETEGSAGGAGEDTVGGAGGTGGTGTGGCCIGTGGSGGTEGHYVRKNSNTVTVTNNGTVNGTVET